MVEQIIEKLKIAELKGRGGAAYPTWMKWNLVKEAHGEKKYVICNASEGEPGVFKDKYILEHYPEEVINGMQLAMETVGAEEAYVFLNKEYFELFGDRLKKIIGHLNIKLFKKQGGYLSGEETTLINELEWKRPEPRLKPPYPVTSGLFNYPTLVNNVETFYCASKIAKDEYKKTRFYSISGDTENARVFELPEDWPIKKILEETKNWPQTEFFVQVDGGASGKIFLSDELECLAQGNGALIIYDLTKTDLKVLMKKWAEFFVKNNCDKCVPCREGAFRLREMLEKDAWNNEVAEEIFFAMEQTAFCPLGKSIPGPFKTLLEKIWKTKK